jgi:uncharacterized protein YcfJ
VLGAVSSALIGSAIGGGTCERVGAAMAGAAIGGLIGNRIGASMDEQDRQYAYETEMSAFDRGARRAATPTALDGGGLEPRSCNPPPNPCSSTRN